MAWNDEINPVTPPDTEFVSQGAARFRELKRALIERLSTSYLNLTVPYPPREGEDLLFPIAGAMVGNEALRPAAPSREGHIWFSVDTGRLWVGNRDGQWQLISSGGGGGGGATPVPFVHGNTLIEHDFGGSTGTVEVTLFSEPESEPARDLRSIRFRVFPSYTGWNGVYGYELGTLVQYPNPSGGLFRSYNLRQLRSVIEGSNRLYKVFVDFQGTTDSPVVEIEIGWSFWASSSSGTFPPVPPEEDYSYSYGSP
jgi:hypothetical protein